jgi:dihydropteroate synthase
MAILNATPDSFFEGSRVNFQMAVDRAGAMINDGADILDIGGQSTRPGSIALPASKEEDRVLPVIDVVCKHFPQIKVSVDTWYASVAQNAISLGAKAVNDISAGDDDAEMLPLIAKTGVQYIAMHKQGQPASMQNNPVYQNVVHDILDYFKSKKMEFEQLGITNWVLDPGFGFGKTTEHNFSLLRNLRALREIGVPILAGLSRKGMIWRTLNIEVTAALNGTTALNIIALINGADILRVHDVKEAAECRELYKHYIGNENH